MCVCVFHFYCKILIQFVVCILGGFILLLFVSLKVLADWFMCWLVVFSSSYFLLWCFLLLLFVCCWWCFVVVVVVGHTVHKSFVFELFSLVAFGLNDCLWLRTVLFLFFSFLND